MLHDAPCTAALLDGIAGEARPGHHCCSQVWCSHMPGRPCCLRLLRQPRLPDAIMASPFWPGPITVEPCQPPAAQPVPATPAPLWSTAASCAASLPSMGLDRLLAAAFEGHRASTASALPVQSRAKVQARIEPGTALQQQLQQQTQQQQQQQQPQVRTTQKPSRLQARPPAAAAPKLKVRQHAPQRPHRAVETASKAPAFMAQAPGHAAAACLAPQAPITPCIPRAAQHKPAKAGPSKQTPKAAAANALAPGGFSSTAAAAHSKAAKAPDAAPRKRKAPEELDAAEVCPCKQGLRHACVLQQIMQASELSTMCRWRERCRRSRAQASWRI